MGHGSYSSLLGVKVAMCICIIILIAGNFVSAQESFAGKQNSVTDTTIANQPDSKFQYSTHILTAKDVAEMEAKNGVRDPNKNYNDIIDGHGTGYAPPTNEDYTNMIGTTFVDKVLNPPTATSADLSTDSRFPYVGNQGNQGSCTCWATGYYSNGFNQGKDWNWTDAKAGANSAHRLSAAWVYNKVDGGSDQGSDFVMAYDLMIDTGTATLKTMPFVDTDATSWGTEAAWREAPIYRGAKYETTTLSNTAVIKSWIDAGYTVNFAMDANVFNSAFADGVYVINSADYTSSSTDHAQTIVGYDDTLTDGSDTGAFRIVNSWDTTWGDNGYYWFTYAAIKKSGDPDAFRFFDNPTPQYMPKLIGIMNLNPAGARNVNLTIGMGKPSVKSMTPRYDGGSSSFPTFMCFDYTEYYSLFMSGTNTFYLSISQSSSTITNFQIELYVGTYKPGNYTAISAISPDCPKSCSSGTGTVYVTFSVGLYCSVVAPNGGESWQGNTYKNITWQTAGGNGTVTIALDYSTTGNTGPWTNIIPSTTNTGSYMWMVPPTPSVNCFVRVTATDSSTPVSTSISISKSAFSITTPALRIVLTSPKGGVIYYIGTSMNITWNGSGGIAPLSAKLELSTNGTGGPWTQIVASQPAIGTYVYTVPAIISTKCYVRATISDSSSPSQSKSVMNSPAFSINYPQPSITLTAPKGGEQWLMNASHSINWTASGGTGTLTIKLQFSTKAITGPWTIIDTNIANSGTYTWSIPGVIPSATCYIKATVTDTAPVPQNKSVTNLLPFSINAPALSITLTSPNGGEIWQAGSSQNITWTAGGGFGTLSVKLEYSTTGNGLVWYAITAGTDNTGMYGWAIPNSVATDCFVRATVSDKYDIPTVDTSNANFTISSAGALKVTVISPNGGELWVLGSVHNVTWNAVGGYGTLVVALDYSKSGSNGPWLPIANDLVNTGIYAWTLPASGTSANCYVRATTTDSINQAIDLSNSAFSITYQNGSVDSGNNAVIKGVVSDSNGPLSGAKVSITQFGNMVQYQITTSDGKYSFSVPPGTYGLQAAKDAYDSSDIWTATPIAKQILSHDFVLVLTSTNNGNNNNPNKPSGGSGFLGKFGSFMSLPVLIILIVLVLIVIIAAVAAKRRKKNDKPQFIMPPPPTNQVQQNVRPSVFDEPISRPPLPETPSQPPVEQSPSSPPPPVSTPTPMTPAAPPPPPPP